MEIRASICAMVDNAGEVDEAECWLQKNREQLAYVSEIHGCGCCVVMWDVQGPQEIIDTLPKHLSTGSSWVSGISE
jgi:hypothetical protein